MLYYAEGMVMSRLTLGIALVGMGSKEEARNALSAAAAAAHILVMSHPDKPLFLQRLIQSKTELAGVEAGFGRFDDAIVTLEDASRQLREAAARYPKSAPFREMVWEIASRHRTSCSNKAG